MRDASVVRTGLSEAVGTALLLAIVVGSGIMAERLAGGNVAIALLANAIATGCGLIALILMFGATSGAHFNPVVSVFEASRGAISWPTAATYVVAQAVGAFVGVICAHAMFELPVLEPSAHVRAGASQFLSESIATFGLLITITGCSQKRGDAVPYAVGAYITAAYWFTSSTSFANPAVTLARSLTNTFAGIRPADAPAFLVAQACGALCAYGFARVVWPNSFQRVQEST